MRILVTDSSIKLWLSARDTELWAFGEHPALPDNLRWPCSFFKYKRLFAEFDRNGLCDLAINGRMLDCDAGEFNAITSDFLGYFARKGKLPADHPAYFVSCGQFL